METSTRIIDYHLKERIEGQNSKITLSGSSSHRQDIQFIAMAQQKWKINEGGQQGPPNVVDVLVLRNPRLRKLPRFYNNPSARSWFTIPIADSLRSMV